MNYKYNGGCKCGKVLFSVTLSQPLERYAPRACDCDFCTERGISYLSDPEGELEIHNESPLHTSTQGSEQAQFLSCTCCQSVVAVVHSFQSGLKGAVNATLINDRKHLKKAVAVSPKRLSPAEKTERWNKVWLPVIMQ